MNKKNKIDIIKIVLYGIMGFMIINLLTLGIYSDYSPFSKVIFNDGIYVFGYHLLKDNKYKEALRSVLY